jgi:hypothetical protein
LRCRHDSFAFFGEQKRTSRQHLRLAAKQAAGASKMVAFHGCKRLCRKPVPAPEKPMRQAEKRMPPANRRQVNREALQGTDSHPSDEGSLEEEALIAKDLSALRPNKSLTQTKNDR